ncbi:hypothetical protein N7G274_003413 [Stereocaulon virgatum]|uniref:Uncharacterized protein n=1 Tax=Stereocaulon virgatum TaxID=373712 RepID=A0ABR4AFM8_9LECA
MHCIRDPSISTQTVLADHLCLRAKPTILFAIGTTVFSTIKNGSSDRKGFDPDTCQTQYLLGDRDPAAGEKGLFAISARVEIEILVRIVSTFIWQYNLTSVSGSV